MVSLFFVNSIFSSIKGLIFTKKSVDWFFFGKYGKFYEPSVFGLTSFLLSSDCKKCSLSILTIFFLSFRKNDRKCWKNCACENALFAKGQLILKCPFGVIKSSKKPTNFFPGFLP